MAQDEPLNLSTGSLNPDQLNLIFQHLPLEITFVDEHDVIRYYSDVPNPIFPRTPERIGMSVLDCHPPETQAGVRRLLQELRSGGCRQATAVKVVNGRMIYIKYLSFWDVEGNYRGVLETAQDVTDFSDLRGEGKVYSGVG
ncbi:MAG: PAS domain-containing protein [bacterium]